jgi:transcriptional regulator with XRE-family HTH domain
MGLWHNKAMNLREIGSKIAKRRIDLGLSQERLARLSNLSRSTILRLENGTLNDLGAAKLFSLMDLLGLNISMQGSQKKKHALELVSQTASVSYKNKLSSSDLVSSLVSGNLSEAIFPYVATLLDEAPLPMIISAVEEAAKVSKTPPKIIWKNIDRWTQEMRSPRAAWR